MNSLNELFDQILRSEQSFRERLNKLRELSSKVQDLQLELKALREQVESTEGELVLKNQKLADAETEAKMMRVRHGVLSAQVSEQQQVQETLEKNSDEAARVLSTLRQEFVDQLKEFSHSYDLCGLGTRYREDVARRQIKHVENEVLLLEAELTKMDVQMEGVEKLQREIAEIELKLSEDRKQEQVLKDKLAQQDGEWKELQLEKEALAIKFANDPELMKIQNELASCLSCSEEEQCRALEEELEDLHRQCYQKQMRQQLNLQQRGQRKGAIMDGRTEPPALSGTNWRPSCKETGVWTPGREGGMEVLRIVDEDWLDGEEEEEGKGVKLKSSKDISCQMDWMEDIDLSKEELASLEREVGGATDDDLYLTFDCHELSQEDTGQRLGSLDYSKKKAILPSHISGAHTVGTSIEKEQSSSFGCHSHSEWQGMHSVQLKPASSSSKQLESKDPLQANVAAPPWELQRKKPGQSIYKAPGHLSRPSNYAKKVRFHY